VSATVDYYFDFSSPFAYLGTTQIESVVQRAGGTLVWKPFLLGALFKAIGTPLVPLEAASAQRQAYNMLEMKRWASWHGVAFNCPSNFPMNTVKALRVTLALLADGQDPAPWIHRTFRAFWAEDQNISKPEVLAALLEEVSLPKIYLEKTADPEVKKMLFAATEAAVNAGVFGAPTSVVISEDGAQRQLFWGQDRLQLVEKAIGGWSVS